MMDYFGGQLDPSQFQARPYKYFGDFTLTANQILSGQTITLRGQEMFFAIMRLMAVSTGPFRISLYSSTSERYQSGGLSTTTDRVRSECMFGSAQRPGVPPVPIVIPGSSTITQDLEDVSGANNSLHLVYEGVRLFALRG